MTKNEAKRVPAIRFKDFSDKWDEQKLKNVTVNLDKLRVPVTKSKRIPGPTPYYGANGIQDHVKGFTHDGKLILIAEDGANDINDYPIQIVTGKVWVNNHAHILMALENISNYLFIGKSLKTINIKHYLTGSGRTKLNKGELEKITLSLPSLPEQVKIGTFLQKIDQLITVKKYKLAKRLHLKALLQQRLGSYQNCFTRSLYFTYFTYKNKQRQFRSPLTIPK
ncbi:restriction endonuclease subunit S [Fructilactobacillus carniphilus]|uniref:Restriction endonuclease subunit S n=1 Tax=Fructilactobacillus carniphilus TaxID=2940297 RepID=A0ABY5BVW9_9LACO|nr:restriction endonuclease subunit S [Fructilactobacillus carniphilus]USS90651.1 restriction endonuclease subunit S [Fructilactobacillus carniphilus]